MRIWSIHPRFLDTKGLVALWREALLAKSVLRGKSKGYRHHPQLDRFRAQPEPAAAIDAYLSRVFDEAVRRGYSFDSDKIEYRGYRRMTVTRAQLDYEWSHLLYKLRQRDTARYRQLRRLFPEPHPCFRVVDGPIESWERPTQ